MKRVLVPARTGISLKTLSSRDEAKKRSLAYAHLGKCNLCPRLCGVKRFETTGMCLIGDKVKVNVVAPHFGEEPCIQGHNGSGAVFMSGCNLRCVFCQNFDIAHQRNGMDLTPEELAEWYVKLQEVGQAHHDKPLAKTLGCTEGEEDAASEEARYAALNRTLSERELSVVKKAAYASGLWRFNEPPKHDGFAI
ncbi:hypothetical protein E4U58_000420 [Claviceps cyperi]|nr:hypothetical protein E4U58_000420 [Claviceps cyperi]